MLRIKAGDRLQAQHFLACPGSERDAVGAGGRLQGRHGGIRIGIGRENHALFFNEIASTCQQIHDTFDDLIEQDLQLFDARRAHGMECRHIAGSAKDPIDHGAMQMNNPIGGRAKTLDQSDSADCGLRAFQFRLFDQKCGNGAMSDLHYWREQMGMVGEQVAQRNWCLSVALSSVDTPIDVKPIAHAFTASKATWCKPYEGIPAFETLPKGALD